MNIYRFCFPLPAEETCTALAGLIAPFLRVPDVIVLRGDLGMGKTTLARALIRQLVDLETDVPSPTFTLVQTYDTPSGPLWHFDLYRLSSPHEVEELGWEEALSAAITLVEWPERLGPLLPRDRLDIRLSMRGEGRQAGLEGHGSWAERLSTLASGRSFIHES
ncbi:MAG: tRNA (adenosine(37)-N6)-threonylcarbamoyltransferase complex ATPase subunit type 1 TsaE [Pseudomonadota bacterium]|nr:tRNA (adenosine(37)-N6)-threonylcarbamoyltransferase complex ATPase subunit type 1 TsaE [Pseudomonadota bacterium]